VQNPDRVSGNLNCGCSATRRGFLSSVLALGAGAALPGCAGRGGNAVAALPSAAPPSNCIDVHHHLFSPAYIAALTKANMAAPIVRSWSVARTLEEMDAAGVATSILSLTTPQVSFADAETSAHLARESNEWAARLAQDHPGRFGSFAVLPMHSTEAALRELEYALDVLKADGVGVLTSYGDKWLGDAAFAPIFDELNRRKAVLFTHPTIANCCRNLQPGVPGPVIEYGTDTTRTIADIVFSGTAARCADLRIIFSHAGGTMPFLTERFLNMPIQDPRLEPMVPNGVLHELRRFFYDTAWSSNPMPLASLTRLVQASQILFGSDYPYRREADTLKGLADFGFSGTDLRRICRSNAAELVGRA
jgi:predicted TIM-barrel fold metal-dependent hydrolase